jgi:arginase
VREHEADTSRNKSVAVLGVPASDGQPLKGAEDGAKIARERGLLNMISDLGHTTVDAGDVDVVASQPDDPLSYSSCGRLLKNSYSVGRTTRLLYERSIELRLQDQLPVVVGGDHSIAGGSVAAALKADPDVGVLWVDAHADLHTPESSPSMNMHGMPLSFLMGLADPRSVAGMEWMAEYDVPVLKPSRLVCE